MIKSKIKKIIHDNKTMRFLLLSHRKSDRWRKKEVNRYLSNHEVAKLQIGCGPHPMEGWLNTDIMLDLRRGNILYMDAGKPYPIPDASFDYVYSEHLFEHLTYPEATNMLKECYRILKPNGIIRIATPNLKFLVDLYEHPQKDINKAYIEFNAKRSRMPSSPVYAVNYFHTSWGHKIIYDLESLSRFLEEVGFKDITQCEMSKSNHAALNNVEQHFKGFPYNLILLETMIIEARR